MTLPSSGLRNTASNRIPAAALIAISALATGAAPAVAADALWTLQSSLQTCLETGQAQACRQAETQVGGLRRNRAYAQASHLCKEEIGELAAVVALLPQRDALPNEVMASMADVQQACQPYGF